MNDQMREEFKLWAYSKGMSLPVHDEIDYNDWTQLAWDAWQASRASIPAAFTAVDMATAAADWFRDGAASVVVTLPEIMPTTPYTTIDRSSKNYAAGYNKALRLLGTAILAAGGRIKDE